MKFAKRLMDEYGMLFVLGLLAVLFSVLTWKEQQPTGLEAAKQFLRHVEADSTNSVWFAVAGNGPQEDAFAQTIETFQSEHAALASRLRVVRSTPQDARRELEKAEQDKVDRVGIALSPDSSQWKLFERVADKFPNIKIEVIAPRSYYWPNFLKTENLLNIANQIVVIAVIAIGMTLVIIAGGIDLSVGSLIALSAVLAARMIRDYGGGESATWSGMLMGGCIAILVCGLAGSISGGLVAWFDTPPFIATLAMMLIASGLAFILSQGQSIDQVPADFVWLGRGSVVGIPNAIWIIALTYLLAHLAMAHMMYGRCVYAIGGNREAARLSGIQVPLTLVSTYMLSGVLAGFGGILMASQLKSGAPTYGAWYELYVITAVVVGGTSLRGGEGKVIGTLIGALIIAVIQNGMNLTGIESYTQKVVFGIVILATVILDHWRKK